MSPKKQTAKKAAAKKSRAAKAPSPMQKMEHREGPNTTGLADQARASHELPEAPVRRVGRSSPPPINTPPTPSPSPSSAVDEGQR